jgi:hypothetical protein
MPHKYLDFQRDHEFLELLKSEKTSSIMQSLIKGSCSEDVGGFKDPGEDA